MHNLKKISATLTIATALLLEACSDSSSASFPEPEPNIKATLLIGTWQTSCIITSPGTTFTGASGGLTTVSGGEGLKMRATFTQEGYLDLLTELYSSADCNQNTSISIDSYRAVYYIGDVSVANDGSDVTNINYSDANSTTYSIFQENFGFNLYLGDSNNSSAENDGSTQSSRHDGLGVEFIKR